MFFFCLIIENNLRTRKKFTFAKRIKIKLNVKYGRVLIILKIRI